MTHTVSIEAAVTIRNLQGDSWLELIGWAKTELEALAAGMHGQTPEQSLVQNAAWSAQSRAMQEIVLEALRAGVDENKIKDITWREVSW